MDIKISSEWMDVNPKLLAYKKAILQGKADKLFHIIQFKGKDEIFDECLSQFAKFMHNMSLADTSEPNPQDCQCAVFGNQPINKDLLQKGSFYIYDSNHIPTEEYISKMITFDISSVQFKSRKVVDLLSGLGLESEDDLIEKMLDDYPGWDEIDMDELVNNTLLAHYEKYDDNVLHRSDMSWLAGRVKVGAPRIGDHEAMPQVPIPEMFKRLQDTSELSKPRVLRREPVQNEIRAAVNQGTEPTMPIADKLITAPEVAPRHDEPPEDLNSNGYSPESSYSVQVETTEAPLPISSIDNVVEGVSEDSVDDIAEKRRLNRQLGRDMVRAYEDIVSKLRNEHDPRWSEFINEYKQAIESGDYSVRLAKRYLNMTGNDTKSPVYKWIYDTDQITKDYQSKVKRIYKETVCFQCHKPFKADVTFATDSEYSTECPNCGKDVRFTLDWL